MNPLPNDPLRMQAIRPSTRRQQQLRLPSWGQCCISISLMLLLQRIMTEAWTYPPSRDSRHNTHHRKDTRLHDIQRPDGISREMDNNNEETLRRRKKSSLFTPLFSKDSSMYSTPIKTAHVLSSSLKNAPSPLTAIPSKTTMSTNPYSPPLSENSTSLLLRQVASSLLKSQKRSLEASWKKEVSINDVDLPQMYNTNNASTTYANNGMRDKQQSTNAVQNNIPKANYAAFQSTDKQYEDDPLDTLRFLLQAHERSNSTGTTALATNSSEFQLSWPPSRATIPFQPSPLFASLWEARKQKQHDMAQGTALVAFGSTLWLSHNLLASALCTMVAVPMASEWRPWSDFWNNWSPLLGVSSTASPNTTSTMILTTPATSSYLSEETQLTMKYDPPPRFDRTSAGNYDYQASLASVFALSLLVSVLGGGGVLDIYSPEYSSSLLEIHWDEALGWASWWAYLATTPGWLGQWTRSGGDWTWKFVSTLVNTLARSTWSASTAFSAPSTLPQQRYRKGTDPKIRRSTSVSKTSRRSLRNRSSTPVLVRFLQAMSNNSIANIRALPLKEIKTQSIYSTLSIKSENRTLWTVAPPITRPPDFAFARFSEEYTTTATEDVDLVLNDDISIPPLWYASTEVNVPWNTTSAELMVEPTPSSSPEPTNSWFFANEQSSELLNLHTPNATVPLTIPNSSSSTTTTSPLSTPIVTTLVHTPSESMEPQSSQIRTIDVDVPRIATLSTPSVPHIVDVDDDVVVAAVVDDNVTASIFVNELPPDPVEVVPSIESSEKQNSDQLQEAKARALLELRLKLERQMLSQTRLTKEDSPTTLDPGCVISEIHLPTMNDTTNVQINTSTTLTIPDTTIYSDITEQDNNSQNVSALALMSPLEAQDGAFTFETTSHSLERDRRHEAALRQLLSY
jgi:hypothetical protein